MTNLAPLLIACLLAGCGGLIKSAPMPKTPPCQPPVLLPLKPLSDQEVEIYWARDRNELVSCGAKVSLNNGKMPKGK